MSDTAILTLRTMLANLDDAKKYQSLRDVMSTLPAPDLAAVFEDLPPEKLPVLFRLCPKDLAAEIFAELTPETQQDLIDGLTDKELKAVVDDLFVDDATDLVEEMPANVVKRILAQADPATRRMINELLKYPEDSAGGVMTTELMELRPDWTVAQAMDAIRNGACIVTDTQMAKAGINKRALARYGGEAYCFMSDEDVAALAKKNGTTRATASMDKAAEMDKKLIFAIGNAPTALVRLYELIENGKLSPELIIGVPVGFVNVVQSKELIMHADVPYIVAKGRKGGSNIAACIVNALLYMIDNRRD